MSDALFAPGMSFRSAVSPGMVPDNVATFPVRTAARIVRSASNPAVQAAGLAGAVAVGLLGTVIVAASLLAICFCFVPG